MKIIFKNPLWFTVITALCLIVIALLVAVGCNKSETPPDEPVNPPNTVNDVSFTPCQQSEMRSGSEFADNVTVEFTDDGIKIRHKNFAVTCDFGRVLANWYFENGVLYISQLALPNKANCICYTNVSYTIPELSQNEVNIIYINSVQVYCHNEPKKIPFENYSLGFPSCQWTNLDYNFKLIIINNNEELYNYITCWNYSEIDFSKYTLLLAHGITTTSALHISCRFRQFSEQYYKMEVNVLIGFATVERKWQLPIIVNKLSEESTVELTITNNNFNNW